MLGSNQQIKSDWEVINNGSVGKRRTSSMLRPANSTAAWLSETQSLQSLCVIRNAKSPLST